MLNGWLYPVHLGMKINYYLSMNIWPGEGSVARLQTPFTCILTYPASQPYAGMILGHVEVHFLFS